MRLSLVEDLLAAPGSNEGWSTFLLRLCDALGGSAASFIAHDFVGPGGGVSVSAKTDPQALVEYGQNWHRLDPWAHAPGAVRLTSGSVVVGDALVPWPQMQRTPFYNDFSRHYDIVHCLAGMIEVSPKGLSCLSVNAAEKQRFEAAHVELLSSLMAPVQRALTIHRRLAGAELRAANAAAVLDRLPHGVLFVTGDGRIVSTNRAADEILRARDGISCDHGELRGTTTVVTTRLRASIADATRSRQTGAAARVGFGIPRNSGRHPLTVVVTPLPRAPITSADPAVAIFVTDQDRVPVPSADEIRALFGLTPAEARLAAALGSGLDLRTAAERLDITIETARTRLKDIFLKTGTTRQAELVRLILATSANLR